MGNSRSSTPLAAGQAGGRGEEEGQDQAQEQGPEQDQGEGEVEVNGDFYDDPGGDDYDYNVGDLGNVVNEIGTTFLLRLEGSPRLLHLVGGSGGGKSKEEDSD